MTPLDGSTSAFLDMLRFGAALLVFAAHFSQTRYADTSLPKFSGHAAVIIFFVLSGYVIAFTAATKDHSWLSYASNRLARLYSVVLPAILLTVVLDHVGTRIMPDVYRGIAEDHVVSRALATATFTSELWSRDVLLLSDDPFWSLPYEFWYYALFGVVVFAPGRLKWVLAALLAVIVGPKILLYLPIWVLGVWLYRMPPLRLQQRHARLILIGCLILFPLLALAGRWSKEDVDWLPIGFSVVDYAIASVVALAIAAFPAAGIDLTRHGRSIRALAGTSFALYLMHRPIQLFLAAVLPLSWPDEIRAALLIAGTLSTVVLLVPMTEQWKRQAARALVFFACRAKPALCGKAPPAPLGGAPAIGSRTDS